MLVAKLHNSVCMMATMCVYEYDRCMYSLECSELLFVCSNRDAMVVCYGKQRCGRTFLAQRMVGCAGITREIEGLTQWIVWTNCAEGIVITGYMYVCIFLEWVEHNCGANWIGTTDLALSCIYELEITA